MHRKQTPPAKCYVLGTRVQLETFERHNAEFIANRKKMRESGVKGRYRRYYDLQYDKTCKKPPDVVE